MTYSIIFNIFGEILTLIFFIVIIYQNIKCINNTYELYDPLFTVSVSEKKKLLNKTISWAIIIFLSILVFSIVQNIISEFNALF